MYKIVFALIFFGSVLSSKSLKCYSCKGCDDLSEARQEECSDNAKCVTAYQLRKNGRTAGDKLCADFAQTLCDEVNEKAKKDDSLEYYTCRVCSSDLCNSDIFKSASLLLVLSLAFLVLFLNK